MTLTVNNVEVQMHMVDVLNNLFGYSDGACQAGYKLPENDEYIIWFVKLSDGQRMRGDIDWFNLLSSDGTEIVASWAGKELAKQKAETRVSRYLARKQIVFANRLGSMGYEFLGVFECQKGVDGSWYQTDGKRHYKRLAVSVDTDEVRLMQQCDEIQDQAKTMGDNQSDAPTVCKVPVEKPTWYVVLLKMMPQFPYVVILRSR